MSLWRRWVAFLDRREAATSLALARIVLGATIASHLAYMAWVGGDLLVWADAAYGGLRTLEPGWLAHVGGLTPENVRGLLLVTTFAAVAFTLGVSTRVAAFVTWVGFRTLADLNSHAGGAYDELAKNILLLLLVSGCGRALSFDAWWAARKARAGGAPFDPLVPAWPRYVLIFQLVLMYWATGMQKVSSGWVPGGSADALWYILQQPTWQRREMTWLAPLFPLTQLATLGTWFFEQGAPLLLLAFWFRHTRTRPGRLRAVFNRLDVRSLYLLVGLGMHAGIEATMDVGAFSWATMAIYVACFHPDEWTRLGKRLGFSGGAPRAGWTPRAVTPPAPASGRLPSAP
ncbi:MAG: HTTM domain-containing protein [Pseudomonadota bacterium]|nr:HTTM domain-containing protein [Pseudomonadota bacterium]